MSGPNVLVNFRLDRDTPVRLRWHATDGVPGDGYKPQITAIVLRDGARLAMDSSAIVEQTAADPGGGIGGYLVTFTGVVGYATDHADRPRIDRLEDEQVDYELEFVGTDGRIAAPDRDYELLDQPQAWARKLTKRDA